MYCNLFNVEGDVYVLENNIHESKKSIEWKRPKFIKYNT